MAIHSRLFAWRIPWTDHGGGKELDTTEWLSKHEQLRPWGSQVWSRCFWTFAESLWAPQCIARRWWNSWPDRLMVRILWNDLSLVDTIWHMLHFTVFQRMDNMSMGSISSMSMEAGAEFWAAVQIVGCEGHKESFWEWFRSPPLNMGTLTGCQPRRVKPSASRLCLCLKRFGEQVLWGRQYIQVLPLSNTCAGAH